MTLDEAKKFYLQYKGNSFYIDLDGESVKQLMYKKLEIPHEQELAWLEESIIECCEKITIKDDASSDLKFSNYMSLFQISKILVESPKIYFLCDRIIDTLDYAFDNITSYQRISLVEYISKDFDNSNVVSFIPLLIRIEQSNPNSPSLIKKLYEKVCKLLENTDTYDVEYRDRILEQFNKIIKDLLPDN